MLDALEAARLFEPDRNEENKPMNMFIGNKGSQTCYKRTNNIEVKPQTSCRENKQTRTSQETLPFYDWLLSILNSLHAHKCSYRLCMS